MIITNNPRVWETYGMKYCVLFKECSFDDVLYTVRDKVQKGHRILSHPLSGSVKPNETPYKSIMITVDRGRFDEESEVMIEDAITVATSGKFEKYRQRQATFNQRILADFQMIDFYLITSAIESAATGLI